ncbi:dihydrofolate reductase family protein [Loigolactobacillus backii]|uniref:Dihydrofolate reductase n=1 Tax=Loigolactobacillus backii TaxID=375175 RepID=A0A192H0G7_9LACO|nr:dihydrofolate reductase family protein [Loigolactobacillus backii]ANK60274.1 dihydrofolate reductase [Loigolactobacillus backii]ANK62284.1 dihydrofolate reductase [Loigolactobacillus backii]ANK65156.1 dihydrofolate reductase [Loigolactobacillus backii]ANK67715.1 dihydrofolate reductase [Loigolactobacillus backii]ANK70703.1 dihydrofolate reductase [Loigolactobacillus backii]
MSEQNRNVVLYLIQSLDGYIAEEDGDMAWLQQLDTTEADSSYQSFYSTIDTVIMGRKTYLQANNLAGSYPYSDKQNYVFSTTLHDTEDRATVVAGNVTQFVRQLKNELGQDIWLVGGADLFSQLLKVHLIDKLVITIAPVLLGKGIPLLNTNLKDVPLALQKAQKIGQLVQLTYQIEPQ